MPALETFLVLAFAFTIAAHYLIFINFVICSGVVLVKIFQNKKSPLCSLYLGGVMGVQAVYLSCPFTDVQNLIAKLANQSLDENTLWISLIFPDLGFWAYFLNAFLAAFFLVKAYVEWDAAPQIRLSNLTNPKLKYFDIDTKLGRLAPLSPKL